ncbi:hypothetical protein K8D10_00240 [Aeromonas veronii]|uniref:hypothetical protein n=1 Tax=Aeromonas veronii TaxID=654 RepID=UPI00207C5979|nr:hypothetical protein [Aeromonas veronii]MCO4170230.1 hypothetical protein [Aeromonas veronii]
MTKRLTGVKFAEHGEIVPTDNGMQVTVNGQQFDLSVELADQLATGLRSFIQFKDGLDLEAKTPYFLFPLDGIDDVSFLMTELEEAGLMPSGLVPATVTVRDNSALFFTALPPMSGEVLQ